MATRFKVYRNLNKHDAAWYSYRLKNIVQGYHQAVLLTGNISLKHATAGQQQQIRSGHRHVCQWITSNEMTVLADDATEFGGIDWRPVDADPRKHDGFCDAIYGGRIEYASAVLLCSRGMFYTVQTLY